MEIGALLSFASDVQRGNERTPRKTILYDPHFLISHAVGEINGKWEFGALGWMKRECSQEWKKMVGLEKRINNSALRGDVKGLNYALKAYKALMLTVVKEFLSTIRENGELYRGDGDKVP
ncbi:MAG: hypothetical protein ACFFCW_28830 [Candidatus Hodarchaeota archaeon]